MEKFCVIIPDRGDRPEFLKHCIMQLSGQTLPPTEIYLIDYKPENDKPDLVQRVKKGIELAKKQGIDICYIIENDDYYPDNYFGKMFIGNFDFIGIPKTTYYNIRFRKFGTLEHQTHSSLFCTGFRISALNGFTFPADDYLSLDKVLWDFARQRPCFGYRSCFSQIPIGIKHGIGFCPNHSHNNKDWPLYTYDDPALNWLKKQTRPESFEFYKSMRYGTPGTD